MGGRFLQETARENTRTTKDANCFSVEIREINLSHTTCPRDRSDTIFALLCLRFFFHLSIAKYVICIAKANKTATFELSVICII